MKTLLKEKMTRGILLTLSGLVLLFGFFGILNTEIGQHIPVIRELALELGYKSRVDNLSSSQMERFRTQAITHLKGDINAPHRPAIGLNLDSTTIREAANWLQSKGLSCVHGVKGYAFLRCHKIPSKVLGLNSTLNSTTVIDEMDLGFNSQGKLISVNLLHRKLSALQGVELINDISQGLRSSLGVPTKMIGANDVKTFATAMNSVSIEYNFKDYLAKVTASYLPWSGVVLYEQYLSYKN
ncbi:hypothetical protein [Bdellovibrio svalbardensis]|uniref:Uncharacterized protein n=1 Tax=Bdellovibrio svalbardensis TaxID=2972972 RepID=A0ABT6DQB5_9BACT|nr:hypothetical protein [Bdellovibrio svalbardensis]MDG0818104.1 hypothetical protein [Bdellovibrio svalbardensis]